jgi:hypothetical protein
MIIEMETPISMRREHRLWGFHILFRGWHVNAAFNTIVLGIRLDGRHSHRRSAPQTYMQQMSEQIEQVRPARERTDPVGRSEWEKRNRRIPDEIASLTAFHEGHAGDTSENGGNTSSGEGGLTAIEHEVLEMRAGAMAETTGRKGVYGRSDFGC